MNRGLHLKHINRATGICMKKHQFLTLLLLTSLSPTANMGFELNLYRRAEDDQWNILSKRMLKEAKKKTDWGAS